MVLFCAHSKSPNTTKIGVSAGTGENPKMALLVAKVPFWEGASKVVLISVIPQKLNSAENTILFVFLLFGGFVFLCAFYFLFGKKPKRLFSCNFRVFVFVSPKGLCLTPFFSSYSVFFSGFPFVFPFKTPFFLCLLSINPFWKIFIFLVSLSFFFLPFPFLMFAGFFQTNFPNILFLKLKLLSFLVAYSFLLLFCFCFHVSAFLL